MSKNLKDLIGECALAAKTERERHIAKFTAQAVSDPDFGFQSAITSQSYNCMLAEQKYYLWRTLDATTIDIDLPRAIKVASHWLKNQSEYLLTQTNSSWSSWFSNAIDNAEHAARIKFVQELGNVLTQVGVQA